jgi:sugar phosphate isomerase/epimerase
LADGKVAADWTAFMTKLAFSTNAFKRNTLEEAIDAIAAAGYWGVELMADVPHAYPPSFDSAARIAIKHRIVSLRLKVSNINAFTLFALGDTYHPTWIESDERKRESRIEHTMACIELANEMECGTISIQPGGPMIASREDRKTVEQRFADGLERLLPLCERKNVTIAVEPEPGLLIQTAAEYREFKSAHFADDRRIKMNCDIGHLFCVGEEPAEVIRSMPNEIAHVHLEDIGANRVHQHLSPGKGGIDFRSVFAALSEIGYTGWVTVELYPYEATAAEVAEKAFTYLKPIVA